jgi:hypothetical protein
MSIITLPDDVFDFVKTFLLDPEYFKRKHAAVWKDIRVKREVYTQRVQYENRIDEDTTLYHTRHQSDYYYFIYSCTNPFGPDAKMHVNEIQVDDITGQYDNVHELIEDFAVPDDTDFSLNDDSQFVDHDDDWHAYEFNQYRDRCECASIFDGV